MGIDGEQPTRRDLTSAELATSIDILMKLAESLRRPGGVNPALAAVVATRARGLLQELRPATALRGHASQGRMTAIDGPPEPASRSQRLPHL